MSDEEKGSTNKKTKLIILASGGDAPGMNPALRAAVRCWLYKSQADIRENNEYNIIAVKDGYNGLVCEDVIKNYNKGNVRGLLPRGGTVIGAGRCENLKNKDSDERKKIKTYLGSEQDNLAGLIVIGGDGSFRGMKDVLLDECKVRVIGIPATIDNDIWGTDFSLGVDTALNTNADLIDKIRDTAAAFRRTFVVEIMGRNCGYLALATAIATESEAFFLPEEDMSFEMLTDIKKNLDILYENKFLDTVIIAAEGAKLKLPTIENFLQTFTKWEIRGVVPGYTQRGGSPSAIDRILGCRFAWRAVNELKEKQTGSYAKVTSLNGIDTRLDVNLDEIIKKSGKCSKKDDLRYRKMIKLQRDLSSYSAPLPYNDRIGTSLLVIHGPDAPGINAAIRAFTRLALRTRVGEKFTGFRTIAVRKGLEGLSTPGLPMTEFIELDWDKTTGFCYSGGVPSNLAQRHNIDPISAGPRNWLRGTPIEVAIKEMRNNIRNLEENPEGGRLPFTINNLVVIGGRDALDSIKELENNGFGLPIIYIPASIDNNIPFTDFSIGYDTALNNGVKAIDKIKDTALSEGRVILIETMGGLSGFLPLSIGIATGVEHIFIPELFKKKPELKDMEEVAKKIGEKLSGNRRSIRRTHAILVFHESIVKKMGGIDSLVQYFGQYGKNSPYPYEVRPTVLGYTLRGGTPSAFDRILATCLGAEAANTLKDIKSSCDVHMVTLENNDIKRVNLTDYISGKAASSDAIQKMIDENNEKKFLRMQEFTQIHCMLSSDRWMTPRLNDLYIFSDNIVRHDRTKTFHQLWEEFWNAREMKLKNPAKKGKEKRNKKAQ